MSVSPARKIAFDVLRRVEGEGAYASDLLHEALDVRVKPADAALATEITLGVLRWRRLLDFLLDRHLKKPVQRLDLPVALTLRIGLYQLRFLERIPARAAVGESVELVKQARKTSAATLVNAVLRRSAEEASIPSAEFVPPALAVVERLAILHSHPAWLVERWFARFGESQTIPLLVANNQRPRLSCALHSPERRAEIFAELESAGMRVEPGLFLKSAFAVSGGSPTKTHSFRDGLISIQDEASQAVPLLLGVQPGDRVLDLCAAPGGKTSALARAAGSAGVVIAADRHTPRLRAMRAQLERLHLQNVRLVELDGEQPLPFRAKFDRILVDAPCSGTGTLARHPEIRWRLRPDQLAEFHQLQVRMLRSAIASLAPGGRLVYSTCSIESEENESVVSEALGGDFSIQQVSADELAHTLRPHLVENFDPRSLFSADGGFGTSPANHTDGFFAAAIERGRGAR